MNDNDTHIAALNYQDDLPLPDPGVPPYITTVYNLPIDGISVTTYDFSGEVSGDIRSDLQDEDPEIQVALDTVESFILAAACAGIDVSSNEFCEAIETTLDAIYGNIG